MGNRILTLNPGDVSGMSLRQEEVASLRALCRSGDAEDRRLGLRWIGEPQWQGRYAEIYIPLLEELVSDEIEEIRFDALGCLGDYCEHEPERVWGSLERLIPEASPEDIAHLSAFLLEHLLEHHADRYFERIRERVESGDETWRMLLKGCYLFGQMKQRHDEVAELLGEK